MNGTTDDPLVRYLLGHATDDERSAIEERLFTEEAFEEELHAAADDVIDDYVGGRLPPAERTFFETRFLTLPRHQERLKFVRALRAALAVRRRPAWIAWAAAASLAAVALSGLLLFPMKKDETDVRVSRVEPGPPARTEAPPPAAPTAAPATAVERRPVAPPRGDRPTPVGAEVRTVHLPRGAEATVDVALGPETRGVRVEVDVDSESPSFDAVIRNESGADVWRAAGLSPAAGDPLVLDVPARLLQPQRYALLIEGEGRRGRRPPRPLEYTLRVVRTR